MDFLEEEYGKSSQRKEQGFCFEQRKKTYDPRIDIKSRSPLPHTRLFPDALDQLSNSTFYGRNNPREVKLSVIENGVTSISYKEPRELIHKPLEQIDNNLESRP